MLSPGANAFNAVSWTAGYVPSLPATDDLIMVIYGDDAGLPDDTNVLASVPLTHAARTDIGLADHLPYSFAFDATFDTITLTPGETHWISIGNQSGTTHFWYQSLLQSGATFAARNPATGTWGPSPSNDLSFVLSNNPSRTFVFEPDVLGLPFDSNGFADPPVVPPYDVTVDGVTVTLVPFGGDGLLTFTQPPVSSGAGVVGDLAPGISGEE